MTGPGASEPRGMTPLERRYRRWMRAYPAAYRVEREDELVGVLLDGAEPGRQRPTPAEVVDLVRAGFTARLRPPRAPTVLRPWASAANLVAILLTLLLGVDALVEGIDMVLTNRDQLRTLVANVTFLPGWYSPWLWTLAAALLVLGWTRPAMAAAWVAVGSRLAAILWLERKYDSYLMNALALGFTIAVLASVLLSRPVSVGRTVAAIGRWRMVASAAAMGLLMVVAASSWLPLGSPTFDATALVLAVVVGALCLVPRSTEPRRRDPVHRRVAIVLGSLALFGVLNSSHSVIDVPVLAKPDLGPAATLVFAAVVVPVAIGVGAIAVLVARRFSVRPARRDV